MQEKMSPATGGQPLALTPCMIENITPFMVKLIDLYIIIYDDKQSVIGNSVDKTLPYCQVFL